MNFGGNSYGPNHWSIPFPWEIRMDQWSWKFFKVSPYTGLGPWTALPRVMLSLVREEHPLQCFPHDGTADQQVTICPETITELISFDFRDLPNMLEINSPRGPSRPKWWYLKASNPQLGRCLSTVRPVFPVLVFQLSKQQNRTRTTSSTVLETPSEPYSDKEIPLRRALRRFALLVGFSTGNPPKIGTFTAWNRTRNRTRTPSDQ